MRTALLFFATYFDFELFENNVTYQSFIQIGKVHFVHKSNFVFTENIIVDFFVFIKYNQIERKRFINRCLHFFKLSS